MKGWELARQGAGGPGGERGCEWDSWVCDDLVEITLDEWEIGGESSGVGGSEPGAD